MSAVAAVAALTLTSGWAVLDAPQVQALTVSPTGSLTLTMLGNGHGHGMSQYGARGAALAGLSTAKILGFYYPGTALVSDPTRRIRVELSGTGAQLTVGAAADLLLTDIDGRLPSSGVSRYRLAQGPVRGLILQRLAAAPGATWTTVRFGLPNGATFHRASWAPVRVYHPDGTSVDYFGALAAFRNTPRGRPGGVTAVDRVGLDRYTAGVVPYEMPTSWPAAAVDAQAVAARTYAANAMTNPMNPHFDICDNTQCQVYGGHAQYNASSQLVDTDYLPAARATSNQVLEYQGAPAFTQFSASNGGWTVAGGEPYLPAKQDPYDNKASGDPWLNYTQGQKVARLASSLGLKTVTAVAVTKRDGDGAWGGRVLAGYVVGTNSSGNATTVQLTGYQFEALFGIGTTWFNLGT